VSALRRRGRWIAAAAAILATVAAAAFGLSLRDRQIEERPAAARPELLLLTSLPIIFPEEFSLDAPASPVLAALQSRYAVTPISIADSTALDGKRLLLMAQPQAQPAQVLVELDSWVRGGGRVVLLADPALEWPSERPLGDVLRPPMAFADTGLLGHWGLRLDSPERLGPATSTIDGDEVHWLSPGTLVATKDECSVDAGGVVARCRIGKGVATVIADADFADVERRLDPQRSGNLGFLLRQLERLER